MGKVINRSGPIVEEIVNSVGKHKFGKWRTWETSFKRDTWRKMDVTDFAVKNSYIELVRENINFENKEFKYHLNFVGLSDIDFLVEKFKYSYPEYVNSESNLYFADVQDAFDQIDQFIEKVNKLLIFNERGVLCQKAWK